MFNFLLLLSSIVFLSLDFIYLNVMKNYYLKQIEKIQGSPAKINYLGVGLCYIFLIIAFNYFIIKPHRKISDAFLLGLVIYGVFNTTNYAILKDWSLITVFIDTLWGGLLFASTTFIIDLFR